MAGGRGGSRKRKRRKEPFSKRNWEPSRSSALDTDGSQHAEDNVRAVSPVEDLGVRVDLGEYHA
jgi:hypothetical protein